MCLSFNFLPLLPSLPSSLQHLLALWLFFAIENIHQEAQAVNINYIVLQASQTTVVFYQFQYQLLALLHDISGFNCLLQFFKFNCNCTSGLLRLKLFSTVFYQVQWFIFRNFIWLSTSNYLALAIHCQLRI
jgi:hypothetical protein